MINIAGSPGDDEEPEDVEDDPDGDELNQRPPTIPEEVFGIVISGAAAAVLLASFLVGVGTLLAALWMPTKQEELRWLRFVAHGVAFTVFARWIPNAWHYRRDDRGGLVFVLILVFLMGYGAFAALFRW